jgi:hypothetical protein
MNARHPDAAVPPHKWSYCPYCGVEAPRPGLHKQGCPAHDKGGAEQRLRNDLAICLRDHRVLKKLHSTYTSSHGMA